ncbi:MAG: YwiC-like family protein [Anaerolineaceae bacterium]|nr:YwiC-like family protein [Anaerolineaceae bacterium]
MIKNLQNIQPSSFNKVLHAKHVAIPSEHGAWIFLFSPLLIGMVIGGVSKGTFPLVLAMLSAFLVRQPTTMLVKIISGRRTKNDLYVSLIWFLMYSLVLLISLFVLILQKSIFILFLALPAIPVFIWHLWLVSKRAERRQIWIEIAASGVLALAAPAAYWVGLQCYDSIGWLLWGLSWLQVAGTILYAYLRLNQRHLKERPPQKELLMMSSETFLFNAGLFAGVLILMLMGWVPVYLPIAFLIQPLEVIWGTYHPAISVTPKKIGIRQLIISSLFTIVFIITWLLG